MKASVAVLADYANVTADGKLNIMGIFNVINALQVPAVHGQMQLIVSFVPDPWESNASIPLEIQLVDADGHPLFGVKGQMALGGAPSGEQSTTNYILNLNNIVFERFGHYDFKILVDDKPFATVPLVVRQSQVRNSK